MESFLSSKKLCKQKAYRGINAPIAFRMKVTEQVQEAARRRISRGYNYYGCFAWLCPAFCWSN